MPVDPFLAWLSPITASWRAGEAWLGAMQDVLTATDEGDPLPDFSKPSDVVLDLHTMRLRRWRRNQGPAAAARGRRRAARLARDRTARGSVLIVAPYALHHASIADLAPTHSIVERMLAGGVGDVWLTEWKSATQGAAEITIDSLLADLLVAVEEVGGPVDLVGLCQGGWLSLAFAGRFPSRVHRLVLVGAPVDFAAASSRLTEAIRNVPPVLAEPIDSLRSGTISGRHLLAMWGVTPLDPAAMQTMLQLNTEPNAALAARLQNWYLRAVDLPGVYLGEVIARLFRRNEIATGRFLALGRPLSLRDVTVPLCLLVGTADDIAPPAQALAALRLVGTAKSDVLVLKAECGHLSLFLGRRTLDGPWSRIVDWLRGPKPQPNT